MPFRTHDVAGMEVGDVAAHLDDLADELMPDRQRRRDRLLRPLVPVVDVDVRTADPGSVDTDQNIVDANLRLRDIGEPEARLGLVFD